MKNLISASDGVTLVLAKKKRKKRNITCILKVIHVSTFDILNSKTLFKNSIWRNPTQYLAMISKKEVRVSHVVS